MTSYGNPWINLVILWIFLLLILLLPARLIGIKPLGWLAGFSALYWVAWGAWIAGFYKPVASAVTPEIGFVFALIIGLLIGNLTLVPGWLRDSARGEWFIKTAIVLLGSKILFTAFARYGLVALVAVALAFPAMWLVAFVVSRRIGLDREFSATLSSGVGICGVSAAIATAAAVGAPPIYATIVSSIIVLFAAVEMLVLPFIAAGVFALNPAAAGAWMGLSVKTDGAAAASGQVVSSLMGADVALSTAVMVKVFIDVWIGLIAFILAVVWVYKIRRQPGGKVSPLEIWFRFPKFVLGYFLISLFLSAIALSYPTAEMGEKAVLPIVRLGTDPLRVVFFSLTFLAIGVNTRLSRFKEIGLGRPLAAYVVGLLWAAVWGAIVAYLVFK
ncbi:MAG: putative sulfate exporter family transporter [Chloroflexota bacterium]|nr:putative sulfate exporter family transporter [Chloroflexota bacterium]